MHYNDFFAQEMRYLAWSHETLTLITLWLYEYMVFPLSYSCHHCCFSILFIFVSWPASVFSIIFLSSLCRTCANHADRRLNIYPIYTCPKQSKLGRAEMETMDLFSTLILHFNLKSVDKLI